MEMHEPIGRRSAASSGSVDIRLAQAEARLRAIERSTSWRLTAPLRALVQLLRGQVAAPPSAYMPIDVPVMPPSDALMELPELCEGFDSLAEWQGWAAQHGALLAPAMPQAIVDEARRAGLETPLFGVSPREEVRLEGSEPREGLIADGLNARLRAVLRVLSMEATAHDIWHTRLYLHEALTPFALRMRGIYARCLCSEYAPDAAAEAALWPVPAVDILRSPFPDAAFDFVLSNEVLEHVPDLPAALRDTARILKPGGRLIGTFPFYWMQHETEIRARLTLNGIEHLKPPEYHGNPVDPEGGSLVFQIMGWDVLDACRTAGFAEAKMLFVSSGRFGITSRDIPGVFVLSALR